MYLQQPEQCYPGCPGSIIPPKGVYGGMKCLCPHHDGGKCLGQRKEENHEQGEGQEAEEASSP